MTLIDLLEQMFALADTFYTPHDLIWVICIVVWSLLVYWRFQRGDPSLKPDAFMTLFNGLWIIKKTVPPALWTTRVILTLVLHVFPIILVYFESIKTICSACIFQSSTQKKGKNTSDIPWIRPLIFFSRTTHSRLFPRNHSFSYSYLLVGIPVGWRSRVNALLSIDCPTSRFSLMTINAADYLFRETGSRGLREKLDVFLQDQATDPEDYPYAYLVTAPRVFGYGFNPASFWYLYNENHALSAVIIEVNNTFDERRPYLLKRMPLETQAEVFSLQWNKDFHVSPFNSRSGFYSITAHDPIHSINSNEHHVSNTITLLSSENKPKIVARLFSTAPPLDPTKTTSFGCLQLLLRVGWIGFMTFPRILREAWKLYFQKGLSVWYRPEVKSTSIGRRPTSIERTLERFFASFLEHVVGHADFPIRLSYKAASGMGRATPLEFRSKIRCGDGVDESHTLIELSVLSPVFYSRFVHYTHVLEAFDHECFCTEPQNVTAHVSQPEILSYLLQNIHSNDKNGGKILNYGHKMSKLTQLRWLILRYLRCRPGAQSYSSTGEVGSTGTDIRYLRFSAMDAFVAAECSNAWLYRRTLAQLFIAQRFAFGFTAVIQGVDYIVRWTLISQGLLSLIGTISSSSCNFAVNQDSYWNLDFETTWLQCALMSFMVANSMHLWSWIKGL